jgi:hypothetical protein
VLFSRAAKSETQQAQKKAWESAGRQFEQELSKVQRKEKEVGIQDDFLEEMDEEPDLMEEEPKKQVEKKKQALEEKKKKLDRARKESRRDSTSEMLYKMKQFHSSKMG